MTETTDLVVKGKTAAEHKFIYNVSLRTEKDGSVLNPVSVLWRVLGPSTKAEGALRDAVLLIGADSLEIYLTTEHSDDIKLSGPAGSARKALRLPVTVVNMPLKLLSKARSSALSHAGSEHFIEAESLDDSGAVEAVVEGHAFSIGVAFTQMLRVRKTDTTFTLWYQPNTIAAAQLSKHPEAKALRFSFSLTDAEDASAVMKHLEGQLERYAQAATFLGRQLPFRQLIQMTGVTHVVTHGEASQETVMLHSPAWETSIATPIAWGQGATEDAVRIYLSTPFGAAAAAIDWSTVAQFRKGNEARFFVSAELHGAADREQPPPAIKRQSRTGTLQHQASSLSNAADDSEDTWQPDVADADDGSSQVQQSAGSRLWQKRGADDAAQHFQIRVHCYAQTSGAPGPPRQPSSTSVTLGPAADTRSVWLAAALALIAIIISISHSRLADMAALSSFGALMYWAVTGRSTRSKLQESDRQAALQSASPSWTLTLVKSEFTEDSWVAAGESMEMGASAQVATAEHQQSWAEQLGLSEDQWQRYLVGFHQDQGLARKAACASKEWRKANSIPADASQEVQPHYEEIKSWFRHGVLCTTHSANPVWLMKVGDMKKGWHKYKASGYTDRDISHHISFCMDYLYNHMDSRELPDGRALWIIDLKGMGMTDMGSDAFNFGKEIALTIGRHWPERVTRIFIVHVPGFFSLLWRIVEPMLATNTRRKIRLLRNTQDMLREMQEEMKEADIPTEYGGQSTGELYASPEEMQILHHVQQLASSS